MALAASAPEPQSVPEKQVQEKVQEQPAPAGEPSLPSLSAEQAGRLERYPTGGQRLLSERIAATREVLERAPDEGYSIELFITDNSDPARMERFLLRGREYVPLRELF